MKKSQNLPRNISISFQMSSVEFFTLVKNHLTEDGVMVVNMNMRDSTNRELFASNNHNMLMRFSENLEMEKDEELVAMMDKAAAGLLVYEPAPIK